MDNKDAWKDSRNLEIECPCNHIEHGEIDDCRDCPYIEDDLMFSPIDAWKDSRNLDVEPTLKEKQLQIIEHYGEDHQLDKLIEECAELVQAICKWKQNYLEDDAIDYLDHLVEEIADVENIIEQYKLTNNYINQEVESWKGIKIDRQLERIKEEK